MDKTKKCSGDPTLEELVPKRFLALLGPNPAIGLDEKNAFDAIFTQLIVELGYGDLLELLALRDLAYFRWEIVRLRGIRAATIEAFLPAAATELLGEQYQEWCRSEETLNKNDKAEESLNQNANAEETLDKSDIEIYLGELFRAADCGDEDARKTLEMLARKAGVSNMALQQRAYVKGLKTLRYLDGDIEQLERRFDQAYRRFMHRRETLKAMTPTRRPPASIDHDPEVDAGITEQR